MVAGNLVEEDHQRQGEDALESIGERESRMGPLVELSARRADPHPRTAAGAARVRSIPPPMPEPSNHPLSTQRTRLLVQLEKTLERPLLALAFVWVFLAIIDLTAGLSVSGQRVSYAIWGIFLVDFLLKMVIAPRKLVFLRRNWMVALSLLLPALRVMRLARVLRLARASRGLRLARLLGSTNRGLRALRVALRRRAAGFVGAATLLVLLIGSAGMMAFEAEGANRAAFGSYGEALWWTAMLMTTIGSQHWPATGAGRLLTLFLSLYSITVFSYLTATLASFFIGRDAGIGKREPGTSR